MIIKLPKRLKEVIALVVICVLGSMNVYPQLGYGSDAGVDFTRRQLTNGQESVTLQGDLTIAANNILNRRTTTASANTPYNGDESNNGFVRDYINVDPDGGNNFSSSTARINIPNCSKIEWAGLYWSGSYISEIYNNTGTNAIPGLPEEDLTRTNDFQNIRFRIPGSGYVNITADDVIYNAENGIKDRPYACFKDVTAMLQGLTGANGDYTVANMKATRGISDGGSAGWVLVVIYEDPTLSPKHITVFDGFKLISVGQDPVTIDVAGFTTIPVGPVTARLAVSVIEGDRGLGGDSFSIAPHNDITNFTLLGSAPALNHGNPTNNFFDSTITNDHVSIPNPNRNIDSENTMGFDADIFNLNNPLNSVIDNGETGVRFRMSTEGDSYGAFLAAFAIDVIEPNLQLVKTVEDGSGNDIGGTDVALGQQLEYVISFQNIGNDDATNTTIRDELPANVSFQDLSANLSLPPGVTYVYNAANHEITFSIPDNLVVEGQPTPQEIRFSVNVVNSCFELRDACSNEISSQAFATYSAVNNPGAVISDDPSYSGFDSCDFELEGPSNYIVDIGNCILERDQMLCGSSAIISAGDDFNTYQWYTGLVYTTDGTGRKIIDTAASTELVGQTNQVLTVTELGTYGVVKTASAPCLSIDEIINVISFTSSLFHPVVPLINNGTIRGSVETCPDNGEEVPKILLCGTNDEVFLDTNIDDTDGISLIWEQLDTNNCTDPGTEGDSCPNTGNTCTWNQVKTGNDYTADTAGEYRLRTVYQGGCQRIFYFDVITNVLDPEITPTDINCNTVGSITVDSPSASAGYEFQLVDNTTGSPVGAYQSGNVFNNVSAGDYYVNVRQVSIVDGCVFLSELIQIRERVPAIDVYVVQPISSNNLGSATVQLSDGLPQYTFELINADDNSTLQTVPAQDSNSYEFTGLAEGNYTAIVRTNDGCEESVDFSIVPQSNLQLTASVSRNITCREGNIQVHSSGGQTPHSYAIYSYNGATVTTPYAWQTSSIFDIPVGEEGNYEFIVVDSNNSIAVSNEVTITEVPPLEYHILYDDETCFGAYDGSITIITTGSGGYIPTYSIDGGATFHDSPTFPGLDPGSYEVVVRGTTGSITCDFSETISIQPGTPVIGTVELTSELSCTQDGVITFSNPTGGSGNYEYSLGGAFQDSPVFTGLTEGIYTPQIRDAYSPFCVISLSDIIINTPNPPLDLNFSVEYDEDDCFSDEAEVVITVTGGGGPFIYNIISPIIISNSSGVFTSLESGSYTFEVVDANGCTHSENLVINDDENLPISFTATSTPASCAGQNDGIIELHIMNISFNYTCYIDNLSTGESIITGSISDEYLAITGLEPGDYLISVLEDNSAGCYEISLVTVAGSESLSVSFATEPITCLSNGSLHVSTSGGSGGYTYLLSGPSGAQIGPQSSGVFENLLSGVYEVTVYDANGCSMTESFELQSPPPVSVLSLETNDPICNGDIDGQVSINADGVSSSYFLQLYSEEGLAYSDNSVTSDQITITGLKAGVYDVFIIDNTSHCETHEIFVLNEPESLTATAYLSQDLSCMNEAVVEINATGGVSPYQYSIDGINFSDSPIFNNLQEGVYVPMVIDSNGCYVSSNEIVIAPSNAPYDLEINSTSITCENETSNITVTPLGGNGPFVFEILGPTSLNANNNGSFSGLTAGNYALIVTDSNGCSYQEEFIVSGNQPINFSFNITPMNCHNNNSGAVVINAENGNGTYQYSITKPDGSILTADLPQFNNLDQAGTYSVLVTDNYGCYSSQNFILEESKCSEDEFAKSVITSPNPASDRILITVEDNFKLYSVELISVKGEVSKYNLVEDDIEVFMDVYDISRGMYILRLTSSDGKVTYKRIIKR